jgi:hypothetical protein
MRRWILSLREHWRQFWFEPALPFNLGFCRVLFFGSMFLFYLQIDFSGWAEVDEFFWKPIWLFNKFHLPLLSKGQLEIAQLIWKAALGLSCIGLLTRPSTVVSFVLGIYILGIRHNFGKISHEDAILVFVLGIMALSRCSDVLSVDQFLARLRKRNAPPPNQPIMSGEYTWPIRAVWLVMALVFFAAGMSKIMKAGLEWVLSDNMSILLLQFDYRNSPLTSWGFYIARYGWICQILAAATIIFETGFPLALLSRKARWVIVPAMASIQLWIQILMGIYFTEFMIVYLFWIQWDRVSPVIRTVGAVGIIFFMRPDWANRIAQLAGIEHNMELLIYVGLTVFAFLCLIYYAAFGALKPNKRT